jgi:hypothetical protein
MTDYNDLIHLSVGHDENGEAYVYRFPDEETAKTFNRTVSGMDVDMYFEYVPVRGVLNLHAAIRDLEEMRA